MPRPQYKLDHVACGVASIADSVDYVQGVLGGEPQEIGTSPQFRFAQLEFQGGGRIELLEPAPPAGGFMERFLQARGPGVHHVTFKVPSLKAAAAAARDAGYDVVGYDDSHPSWKEAFLHPKQAQGLVIQFAESDPSLADWEPNPQDFPAAVEGPPPPPPLQFLGLLVSARSEQEGLRQWSQLLGGEVQRQGGRIGLSWPDSPLRVWIDVDAAVAPGPQALLFSGRQGELGPQPQPLLGVTVTRAPQ